MKSKYLLPILVLIPFISFSNTISGKIIEKESRFEIEFARITITSTDTTCTVTTNEEGNFEFSNLQNGIYNLTVVAIGFETQSVYELKLTEAKPVIINLELVERVILLDTVMLGTNDDKIFKDASTAESPVSLRSLGSEEVERNPGGNRDVSRVIRNLPGVAATPSFRNDIIIRGGSPNENRFYIDGIEVPNINHFATQGASGGPVGMINVNFVKNVDFYSGAFPANRGNALSSIISFDFKEARSDKWGFRTTLGASDIGFTAEGPLSKKTTLMASVRRSYLQFLFKAIGLPFLPTYNDYQFKIKTKLTDNSELTFIGLGALDNFRLNASLNDGETDSTTLRRNNYILQNLPINEQWNYTQGVKYVKYNKNAMHTVVLSRNMLNNTTFKYKNNDEKLPKLIDYSSQEIENKLRYEQLRYGSFVDILVTANLEYAKYNTQTKLFRNVNGVSQFLAYASDINFFKYGASVQANKKFIQGKLSTSIGLRTDANSFSSNMSNPLQQLSPRASASYQITKQFSVAANTGIYAQLPNYTSLGFRNQEGTLINKDLKYLTATHFVLGVKYLTKFNASFSIEGFLKNYKNYPFLVNDSVSLANLGSDFGVVGNDDVNSSSTGKSYGLELLYQQKLIKGFFGILAFTYVNSAFSDKTGALKPSAWDSRQIVSCSFGKKFKRNWQIGTKFSYSGGLPYTPINTQTSSLKSNWDVFNQAQLDLNQINSLRLKPFHALDLRIDKEYFFKKWNIDLYIDIQNVYAFAADQPPTVDVKRDSNGNPVIQNPNAPIDKQTYILETLQTGTGSFLPTFGFILDF